MAAFRPNFSDDGVWAAHGADWQDQSNPCKFCGTSSENGEKLKEQYRTIGAALLSCEASSLRVGIPWVLPTARVSTRKYDVGTRPEDYIRECLVTVSTNNLELYCEDLESVAPRTVSDEELSIELKTLLERYSFSTLLAGSLFVFCMLTLPYIVGFSPFALGFLLCATIFGWLLGCSYSSQAARRLTFHRVLVQEVMRRKGITPGGPGGNRLYSTSSSPARPLSK